MRVITFLNGSATNTSTAASMGISNFSVTAFWAELMARLAGLGATFGIKRKPTAIPLPEKELIRLKERFAPVGSQLENLRQETCEKLDKQARLVLPSVAVVAIGLFVFLGGGFTALLHIPQLLVFVLIAVTVSWLLLQYGPYRRYKSATRSVFGQAVANDLSGFDYDPDPDIGLDALRKLPLFPRVSHAQAWDLMSGIRNGYSISICRLNVNYDYRNAVKRRKSYGANLHAIYIKVAASPLGNESAVLLPDMVDMRIHRAVADKHGLKPASFNDGTLDTSFKPFLSASSRLKGLTELPMRDGLLGLGQLADSPLIVFTPGQTIAMFPLRSDLFVPFTPRPYWEPFDHDQLVYEFALDLAELHSRLIAVVELQVLDQ